MKIKSVLLMGLKAPVVNYAKWPQLSVERLEAAFSQIQTDLAALGYDARWCRMDTGETAQQQLFCDLKDFLPDIVPVGAGVRTDPDHFLLFERRSRKKTDPPEADKYRRYASPLVMAAYHKYASFLGIRKPCSRTFYETV